MRLDFKPPGIKLESRRFLTSLQITDSEYNFSYLYHLFPDKTMGLPNESWPQPWPHGDCAGVYFIFDKDEVVRYIGKASMESSIGNRLSKHFPYKKGDPKRGCDFGSGSWKNYPHYVMTLGFVTKKWLAPAVEEYLITEYCKDHELENIQGH